MKAKGELIKILIPAVGGQGGGVLTEWLVQAFTLEGFEVQGIGLPGLSQRGGSTVYYIEAHPKSNPHKKQVIFSQYPVPGDVDVILAQEFLELGRVLEQGYGSEKTTIISSTHRVFSTLEKMPLGSGIYSNENLIKLAINFSSRFIGFNALELAKENGMDELAVNAILLGALAASDTLPISEASYLKAIEGVGVAVGSNLRAFRIGWEYVRSGKYKHTTGTDVQRRWEDLVTERLEKLKPAKRERYREIISHIEEHYPPRLREILAEATFRLIDYQDVWYAEKYLDYVQEIHKIDRDKKKDFKLTEFFSKNLALMMSYEDGIRVAELKIKPQRFKRIKEEIRLRENQIFRVIDYLKPDAEEIYGLFPHFLVAPLVRIGNTRPIKRLLSKKMLTLEQKPTTTSFTGFLRLWLLTKLKPLRPYSYRYHMEQKLIKKYRRKVEEFSRMDYELGCIVAKSGQIIKGYGKVRRRTVDAFNRFIDNILTPVLEFEKSRRKGFNLTQEIGEEALKLILATNDGIDRAEELARRIISSKEAS